MNQQQKQQKIKHLEELKLRVQDEKIRAEIQKKINAIKNDKPVTK